MYLSVAPLEFKMMGSQILIQGPKFQTHVSCFFWNEKKAIFSPFFPKLKGSGTNCSKIDGFPGTNGTHANGAKVYNKPWSEPEPLFSYQI